LGFIRRISSEFKLASSLKSLYCALVRPILDYGSVVLKDSKENSSAMPVIILDKVKLG